jgi:hypothetical protein
MFGILKPQNGTSSSAKPLHPELLKQYDASKLLPESSESRHVFQNVLRSPKGVFLHTSTCNNAELCRCTHPPPSSLHLRSITQFLFTKTQSRQVAEILHRQWKLSRPTSERTSMHVIWFPEFDEARARRATGHHTGPGGSSLKGHVYSTPLPMAIVTQKVNIQPSDSGVRVLVVSPFTSDALALNKGKIASTRSEYIIRCLSYRPRGIAETTGQRHRKQESFPQ